MDELIWDSAGNLALGRMYFQILVVTLLVFWDYPLLLAYSVIVRALVVGKKDTGGEAKPLPLLVVIPSLLRKRDELTSMQSTIASIAMNGYSGSLTIVVSIDGTLDAPQLYKELKEWRERQIWNKKTVLYVTGTPGRHSKPMAIDRGISFVKELVDAGTLPEFPPIYISTDADADLGPNALSAIVSRLQRRNPFTGVPPNIVAGGLYVRDNNFWQGWRHFVSERGQLNLQVAREYFVSNVGRYNLRALPVTGVPGALYCTWSELYTSIPRFMGYLQTLRFRHWLGWWVGIAPPKFSESRAEPLPEGVAGDTDDTVTAYVGILARYENGHFNFNPPATPLHALYYLLRTLFVARPILYEPEARVFTSSPATANALFRQRKRWNSARVELTLRLWNSMGFHWAISLPAMIVQGFMARGLLGGIVTCGYIPFFLFPHNLLLGFCLGFVCQVLIAGTLTVVSLVIRGEPQYWRILFAVPLTPLYNFVFKWLPTAVGVTCDVLLFGNVTGFSPEWTLKRGKSVRIALLFRVRRAFLLALRSVIYGDVPLGTFWLGWDETPWTPSGFEGWTTGEKPRSIISRSKQATEPWQATMTTTGSPSDGAKPLPRA
jgi:hypothetical protein